MAGDRAADPRQYVREVPQIERLDARNTWNAELQDGNPSARTHHARDFGARDFGSLHVSDAERDCYRIDGSRSRSAAASRRHEPARFDRIRRRP